MTNFPETIAPPSEERRPTIAVVTGSGGIKTFAAMALFEFLDEQGIEPDLLIGCSGGAIMAGLRATGYTPKQMFDLIPELLDRKLFSKVDYGVLLGIPKLSFGRFDFTRGILRPEGLRRIHQRLFGEARLEELRPTTLLQVTDFHSGEGFVLSEGRLADAVFASGASYPALPPQEIDGRWYVDGGFTSPCPVLEAVKRGIDVIIALSLETRLEEEPTSYVDMFNYGQSLCANQLLRSQMATAINLHHYEIVPVNVVFKRAVEFWDLDAIPFVLETGRNAVAARKDEILAAIANFPGK
ncbi:MAG: patatin-like phospholipase family protein [Blastocatellia bacterium]|nr:patatin-like phospholipase family protein [Blastocatellia bacterium]